ncbi:MAG: hypothetical protein HY280_10465 [Nitrospinae bacterium]|nr:hypothetical protein [Nitrospinota bacterium]
MEAIRGHYKDGKIELYDKPRLKEGEIVVTFLNPEVPGKIDLQAKGISKEEAADLKHRLRTFENDWNAEGMDIYDKA